MSTSVSFLNCTLFVNRNPCTRTMFSFSTAVEFLLLLVIKTVEIVSFIFRIHPGAFKIYDTIIVLSKLLFYLGNPEGCTATRSPTVNIFLFSRYCRLAKVRHYRNADLSFPDLHT